MKKLLSLFTVISLFFSSLVVADTAYYSTQQSFRKKDYPATFITVQNFTTDIIFAIVPNSPVNDVIYPNNKDYIQRDDFYDLTHLVLIDPYDQVFFDRYVCRRAFVNVYGNPRSYHVNVDGRNC